MINIDTSKVSKIMNNTLTVFAGKAGSGKTILLVKTVCDIFKAQDKNSSRRYFVYDPSGDIERVLEYPELSEWCSVTEEFKKNLSFLVTLSDLPQDCSNSILMIDTNFFKNVACQNLSSTHPELPIFTTQQLNRDFPDK